MTKNNDNNQPERLRVKRTTDFILCTDSGYTLSFRDKVGENASILVDLKNNHQKEFILESDEAYSVKEWLSDYLEESGELFADKTFAEIEEWKKETGGIYFSNCLGGKYGTATLSAEKSEIKTHHIKGSKPKDIHIEAQEILHLQVGGWREKHDLLLSNQQVQELKEFLNKNF